MDRIRLVALAALAALAWTTGSAFTFGPQVGHPLCIARHHRVVCADRHPHQLPPSGNSLVPPITGRG